MRKDCFFLLKLCAVFLLAASFYGSGMGGCGGGGGGSGEEPSATTAATAGTAAATVVMGGVSNVVSTLSGLNLGGAAALRVQAGLKLQEGDFEDPCIENEDGTITCAFCDLPDDEGNQECCEDTYNPSTESFQHGCCMVNAAGIESNCCSESGSFDAETGEFEFSSSCSCPNGGTMEESFQGSFASVEGTLTFDNCVEESCGEDVALTGEITLAGQFDEVAGQGSFQLQSGQCTAAGLSEAGLTATWDESTQEIGFDFEATFSFDPETGEESEDFSGTLCIGSEVKTIGSPEDLEEIFGTSCDENEEDVCETCLAEECSEEMGDASGMLTTDDASQDCFTENCSDECGEFAEDQCTVCIESNCSGSDPDSDPEGFQTCVMENCSAPDQCGAHMENDCDQCLNTFCTTIDPEADPEAFQACLETNCAGPEACGIHMENECDSCVSANCGEIDFETETDAFYSCVEENCVVECALLEGGPTEP